MGTTDRRPVRDRVSARWPLVGRQRVEEEIERARQHGRRGVLVVGEPGMGKTRLARALTISARARHGVHVIRVGASQQGTEVTLDAFREVLPAVDGVPLTSVLRWATTQLVELGGDDELMVVVDDGHWLDPVSAALVHQLAATGAAFVVVFARPDELPDAVSVLWHNGVAERVEVPRLCTAEVGLVLSEALGDRVAEATVQALARASGGNPLYLRELCLHGLEDGSLQAGTGMWSWQGPIHAGTGLRQLLRERIGVVDADDRRALQLVAFADRIGLGLYEELVGIEAVDRLERSQLIEVARAGLREEVRLAHPLYGDVLREGAEDRPAILATLADAVAAHGGRRTLDMAQVVEWRLAAGQQPDADGLLRAAEDALSALTPARAERLARAAVDTRGDPEDVLVLGSVLRELGKHEEAEAVWAQDGIEADAAMRVRIQIARAQNLFFGLGRAAAAAALLDDASDIAQTQHQRDVIDIERAMTHLYEGRPRDAQTMVEHLLEHEDAEMRGAAATFVAPSLALQGRIEESLRVVDLGLETRGGSGAAADQVMGILLAARYLALQLGGRLPEAELLARGAHELSVGLGIHDGVAIFGFTMGQSALVAGRIDEAIDCLEEAAVLLREHDRNRYLPWCLAELAAAHAEAGDLPAAHAALAEAGAVRRPAFRMFECRLEVAKARVEAMAGRVDDGIERALAAGAWAVRAGQSALAAHAYHEVARLGLPRAAVRPLGQIAEASDSDFVAALAQHALAQRDRDAAGLDLAAARLEAMGAMLHAAEAWRDASDAHREAGDPGAALAAAGRARGTAGACSGARLDWLTTLGTLDGLTVREREVAELIATGLSTRAAAEQLYVSLRTVENHLHRVYTKLGIRGREDLAAALAPGRRGSECPVAHDNGDPSP